MMRRYTVEIESVVDVSAESADEALAKARTLIESKSDVVTEGNVWVRVQS